MESKTCDLDFNVPEDCQIEFSLDNEESSAFFTKDQMKCSGTEYREQEEENGVVTVLLRPEHEKKSVKTVLKQIYPMLSISVVLLVIMLLLHWLSLTGLKSAADSVQETFSRSNNHLEDLKRWVENKVQDASRNLDHKHGNLSGKLDGFQELHESSSRDLATLAANHDNFASSLNLVLEKMDLFNSSLQQGFGDLTTFKNSIQLQIDSFPANLTNQTAEQRSFVKSLEIQLNHTKKIVEPYEATSCAAIQQLNGQNPDNVTYSIYPFAETFARRQSIQVACDFTNDGGLWTIIQRRVSGPRADFYRDWAAYESGFGSPSGNYWIGLKAMNALTTRMGRQELYVELTNWAGETQFARFSNFSVADSLDSYRLSVSGYCGTAGDSLTHHNGIMFTTQDRDNDEARDNCAVRRHGAWWYRNCYSSNLNGLYGYDGEYFGDYDAMCWDSFGGWEHSLQRVEMKIRPAA